MPLSESETATNSKKGVVINMKEILDKIVDFSLTTGVRLLIALIILVVGFRLIGWIMNRMKKAKLLGHAEGAVRSFVLSFSSVALKTLLIITVAAYLGVPMTSIVALVGSAGVAMGLALQGGLSNIASGIMILMFRPFSVGDYISVSDFKGTVHSVGIFHTVLMTMDQTRVIIPNSVLTGETLVNYSAEPMRRVDMDFSASYEDDIDKVKAVLLETALGIPEVVRDPAIEVMLREHSDSALIYRIRVWCKREDYWTVYYAMQEEVLKAFQREGISVPYPQIDVHMQK